MTKVQITLEVTFDSERSDPDLSPYDLLVVLENTAEQQFYVRSAVATIQEV